MIPRLFDAKYTDTHSTFTGHGLGELIDAMEVKASESSENGHEWELSFSYPENGHLFNQIKNNAIVVAKVNNYQDLQAFRIYSVSKALNHTIKVNCQHISYDLSNIVVKPFKVYNARTALASISANKAFNLPFDHFTYFTDLPDPQYDPSTDANTLEFQDPRSIRAVLLDGDDSIHGKYGGDVVIDNYAISLKQLGGEDRGITIEYGKDLTSFDQEINIGEMVTGIYPYCKKNTKDSLSMQVDINRAATTINEAMVTATKAYTLEAGKKYILTFYTENTGQLAYLNPSCGFGSGAFSMDGYKKDFEVEVSTDVTYPAGTVLVYAGVTVVGDTKIGEIYSVSVSSSPIEPLIYGDIAYGPGTYDVQRIKPVDLTKFFADDPTVAELNAKAAEWVTKEEIGLPDVDLTLSYANIDQNVHIYDAVRVRFIRMNVDVKAKVTSYEYDVLKEQVTEISVGKTKDSLYFTLEDASRLKRGILPPDRIGKKSITTEKYARGSVTGETIAPGSVGQYNLEKYSVNEEILSDKAVGVGKLKSWGNDPVIQSVPNNVYGGYDKKVGYLLDPSLGMPPDSMFGWTYTNPLTHEETFHPITKWQDRIPVGNELGLGYVLDPDFILQGDIDADEKLTDGSLTTKKIAELAVTGAKIANGAIDESKLDDTIGPSGKSFKSKIAAWENLYDNVGPEAEYDPVVGDTYMLVPYLKTTGQFYVASGDIAFPSGDPQYGSYHFSPKTLSVNNNQQAYILASANVNISVPNDLTYAVQALQDTVYGPNGHPEQGLTYRVAALEQQANSGGAPNA